MFWRCLLAINYLFLQVTFDFNDGHTETVMLGSKSPQAMTLTYNYTYNTYGIYRVRARVANNISHVLTSTLLHVGENISFVDVYVDWTRVLVGDDVTFRVHW